MKELNNASLPLNFEGGKYSTESVSLPEGQYIVKIVATGPCIGKIIKGNEVLTEVDFSSYKMPYNDLRISFILQSESEISLEVTPKREDIKVYSASLYSSLLPVGKKGAEPTGELTIDENGVYDVTNYAKLVADVYIQAIPEKGTPLEYANVIWENSDNVKQTAITNGEYLDIAYDTYPIVNFVIVWSDHQGVEQWDPSKVQYTEQEYGQPESEKITIPKANIVSESATAGDVGYRFVSVQIPGIFVQTGGSTNARLYYDNQLIAYMGVRTKD